MAKKKSKTPRRREPQPFFREFNQTWYLQLGKRQINLGKDKEAAWERYHELIKDRKDVEATANTTVCGVLETFLGWVKDWRSEGTYGWYSVHLSSFASHVGQSLKLLDLHDKHVTKWIDACHKDSAPDTIYGAIRTVQRAMNWAVKRGYLPKSPVKNVEKPQTEPREAIITLAQFEQIIARCSDENARDFFNVMWETGCRVQEIRKVEAKHFVEAERCWLFPRSQAKGKRSPRIVYLTDKAIEITKRLAAKTPTGPIFRNRKGRPWTKDTLSRRFRVLARPPQKPCAYCSTKSVAFIRGPFVPAAERNGRKYIFVCGDCIKKKKLTKEMLGKVFLPIEGLDEACPTSFRHSFITRALKNRVAGITVSVLVGHRDTRMISRVYSHLEQDPAFLQEELKRATS
jgi:integrase